MTKIALITGSSGGVGKELVETYLKDGYIVIGLDHNTSGNSDSEFFKEINTCLQKFSKDISYRNETLDKIKSYLSNDITNFVLINNAAKQILKPVSEINLQDWQSSFEINTFSPFFLIQELLEYLKLTKGHVINISSIHSKLSKNSFTCYAASKAALEALTRSLAIELSSFGISINAVSPAAISTNMLVESFKDKPKSFEELKDFHPSKTIGSPQEVAKFVKSITDFSGKFLTGSILEINGGIGAKLNDPT